jgi:hypothetical protein
MHQSFFFISARSTYYLSRRLSFHLFIYRNWWLAKYGANIIDWNPAAWKMSWTSTVLRLFADNSAKEPSTYVRAVQGDQIGRFFAQWAIVYLEQFFNTEVAQICGILFPWWKSVRINFDKKWAGIYFGQFLSISSGHTGAVIKQYP